MQQGSGATMYVCIYGLDRWTSIRVGLSARRYDKGHPRARVGTACDKQAESTRSAAEPCRTQAPRRMREAAQSIADSLSGRSTLSLRNAGC